MLVLSGTLLAVLLVAPLGGRLSALSGLRLTGAPLLLLALACQVVALEVLPHAPHALLFALHGESYVLAALFVVRNRALPGLPLLAGGALLNAVVLAVNGGTMPASAAAVRRAGLPLVEDGFSNSGVLTTPHLAPLGDVFASPAWLPLHNVYSPGDLLVLAGAVWCVHRTCRSALARDPRPALRGLRARLAAPVAAVALPYADATSSCAASQPGSSSAVSGRLSR